MENLKAKIALDLVPLLQYLYDEGIMAIYPRHGVTGGAAVHMTPKEYRETFPEDNSPAYNPGEDFPWRWSTTVNGVEFFALEETRDFLL